jgi:hypothetical protein
VFSLVFVMFADVGKYPSRGSSTRSRCSLGLVSKLPLSTAVPFFLQPELLASVRIKSACKRFHIVQLRLRAHQVR